MAEGPVVLNDVVVAVVLVVLLVARLVVMPAGVEVVVVAVVDDVLVRVDLVMVRLGQEVREGVDHGGGPGDVPRLWLDLLLELEGVVGKVHDGVPARRREDHGLRVRLLWTKSKIGHDSPFFQECYKLH